MATKLAFNWDNSFSWCRNKYKNTLLFPEVRIQDGFQDCPHCSLCPSVEVRNQKVWVDEHEYNAKKNLRVDLDSLRRNHPPPISVSTIVEKIKDKFKGFIKATGTNRRPWPFKVKDCKVYKTFPAAPGAQKSLYDVINHIMNEGPVIGAFRVGTNYFNMTSDEVYFSQGQYVPFDPKEPNVPLVHGVCLTGLVEVTDGVLKYNAFEVIDCGKLIPNDRRLRYILARDIDYVYVPTL